MTPNTKYHVTLKKCNPDQVPIITPYNIGKDAYNEIMRIIHEKNNSGRKVDGK
jgi:hypothetical protein